MTSIEFGLFNDEGLVEQDFWSKEGAEAAIKERYEPDDELRVAEVCPMCRGGEAGACRQTDACEAEWNDEEELT